jgi:GMP synthase (glutamine-hydrolysing)
LRHEHQWYTNGAHKSKAVNDMAGRLLYLGNGRKFQSVAKLDDRFETWGLKVDRYWAYDGQFPSSLKGYDGIFLSGSPHGAYEDVPFILREHELIQEAATQQIPMLGICFGSQILGSALCGRDQVFRRSTCEIGYKNLPLTEATKTDKLAHDLVDSVHMFVWHNDEVRASHPDMTILAYSDDCPNQIWRYKDADIWGIQGHPEVTKAQAIVWFEENRERMEKDGARIDDLKAQAHEAAEAKTMLTRFAELVQNG